MAGEEEEEEEEEMDLKIPIHGGFIRKNGQEDVKKWDFLYPWMAAPQPSPAALQAATQAAKRLGFQPPTYDLLCMIKRRRDTRYKARIHAGMSSEEVDKICNPVKGWTYLWPDDFTSKFDERRQLLGLEPVNWIQHQQNKSPWRRPGAQKRKPSTPEDHKRRTHQDTKRQKRAPDSRQQPAASAKRRRPSRSSSRHESEDDDAQDDEQEDSSSQDSSSQDSRSQDSSSQDSSSQESSSDESGNESSEAEAAPAKAASVPAAPVQPASANNQSLLRKLRLQQRRVRSQHLLQHSKRRARAAAPRPPRKAAPPPPTQQAEPPLPPRQAEPPPPPRQAAAAEPSKRQAAAAEPSKRQAAAAEPSKRSAAAMIMSTAQTGSEPAAVQPPAMATATAVAPKHRAPSAAVRALLPGARQPRKQEAGRMPTPPPAPLVSAAQTNKKKRHNKKQDEPAAALTQDQEQQDKPAVDALQAVDDPPAFRQLPSSCSPPPSLHVPAPAAALAVRRPGLPAAQLEWTQLYVHAALDGTPDDQVMSQLLPAVVLTLHTLPAGSDRLLAVKLAAVEQEQAREKQPAGLAQQQQQVGLPTRAELPRHTQGGTRMEVCGLPAGGSAHPAAPPPVLLPARTQAILPRTSTPSAPLASLPPPPPALLPPHTLPRQLLPGELAAQRQQHRHRLSVLAAATAGTNHQHKQQQQQRGGLALAAQPQQGGLPSHAYMGQRFDQQQSQGGASCEAGVLLNPGSQQQGDTQGRGAVLPVMGDLVTSDSADDELVEVTEVADWGEEEEASSQTHLQQQQQQVLDPWHVDYPWVPQPLRALWLKREAEHAAATAQLKEQHAQALSDQAAQHSRQLMETRQVLLDTSFIQRSPARTPARTPASASVPTRAPCLSPSLPPRLTPTFSPVQPPGAPPTFSPAQPPGAPPTFSPAQPLGAPPTFSPAQPPGAPPTFSPAQPPGAPPTFSPAQPPGAPPTFSPAQPPGAPPTFSPAQPPGAPPTFSPAQPLGASPTFSPAQPPLEPHLPGPSTTSAPPELLHQHASAHDAGTSIADQVMEDAGDDDNDDDDDEYSLLEERYLELTQLCGQYHASFVIMQTQHTQHAAQLAAAEQTVQVLQAQMDAQAQQLQDKDSGLEAIRGSLQKELQQKSSLRARNQELAKELEEAEQQLEEAEQQLVTAQEKLASQDDILVEYRAKLEAAQDQAGEAEQQVVVAEEKVAQLQGQEAGLQSRVRKHQDTIKALTQQLAAKSKEVDKLQDKLQHQQESLSNRHKQKMSVAEQRYEKLQEQLLLAQQEHESSQDALTQLKVEHAALQQELVTSQDELTQLKVEHAALQEQAQSELARQVEQESHVKKVAQRILDLELEISRLKNCVEDKDRQLSAMPARHAQELKRLQKEITEHKRIAHNLSTLQQTAEADAEAARAAEKQARTAEQQAQAEVAELQQQMHALQQQMQQMVASSGSPDSHLTQHGQAQGNGPTHLQEAEAFKAELERMKLQLDAEKAQHVATQATLSSVQLDLQVSQEKQWDAAAQHKQLGAELAAFRSEHQAALAELSTCKKLMQAMEDLTAKDKQCREMLLEEQARLQAQVQELKEQLVAAQAALPGTCSRSVPMSPPKKVPVVRAVQPHDNPIQPLSPNQQHLPGLHHTEQQPSQPSGQDPMVVPSQSVSGQGHGGPHRSASGTDKGRQDTRRRSRWSDPVQDGTVCSASRHRSPDMHRNSRDLRRHRNRHDDGSCGGHMSRSRSWTQCRSRSRSRSRGREQGRDRGREHDRDRYGTRAELHSANGRSRSRGRHQSRSRDRRQSRSRDRQHSRSRDRRQSRSRDRRQSRSRDRQHSRSRDRQQQQDQPARSPRGRSRDWAGDAGGVCVASTRVEADYDGAVDLDVPSSQGLCAPKELVQLLQVYESPEDRD